MKDGEADVLDRLDKILGEHAENTEDSVVVRRRLAEQQSLLRELGVKFKLSVFKGVVLEARNANLANENETLKSVVNEEKERSIHIQNKLKYLEGSASSTSTIFKQKYDELKMEEKYWEMRKKQQYDESTINEEYQKLKGNRKVDEMKFKEEEYKETEIKKEYDETEMKKEYHETEIQTECDETEMKRGYDEPENKQEYLSPKTNEVYIEMQINYEDEDLPPSLTEDQPNLLQTRSEERPRTANKATMCEGLIWP